MSDLDSYLTHCYDVMLKAGPEEASDDTELCACANLVAHDENH